MFSDPDEVGTELPDRDPGCEHPPKECDRVESGFDLGTDIDATVLQVFGNE
jgi:hypothetical protein